MSDNPNPADGERDELTDAERNARAFEMLSLALQQQIYDILNGKVAGNPAPADGWAAIPQVVQHAVGTVLAGVLRASLLKGACTEQAALHIIDSVRAVVERAMLEAMPEPGPGDRWH